MSLRDSVSTRLELRLNDPSESEVNRRSPSSCRSGVPGRGVISPGLLFQTTLPRLDGDLDAPGELAGKMVASWSGPVAPPLRMLPERMAVGEFRQDGVELAGPGPVIGISDRDLGPVFLDLTQADQHCIVIGDGGAGKSAFTRTWMAGVASLYPAEAVRFLVVDYRRALMDVAPESYIGAYASDAVAARHYASSWPSCSPNGCRRRRVAPQAPAARLVVRPGVLPGGRRLRHGRRVGPRLPLQPVIEYLPHAREIGLHVVVTRRSGGIARALAADPLISRIRELGATGLILSSDPREGVLLGDQRGAEMPPGRGYLIRRRQGKELIQVSLSDEYPEEDHEYSDTE